MTYRRRSVSMQDIETIRAIIECHPGKSRRFISQEVCRTWNWRQPNGVLKDMVCRSLLLILESKGHIKLPARKLIPHNPLAKRKKPCRVKVDQTPIQCSVSGLLPIKLEQVRKTAFEKLFNGLISEHHYLGYTQNPLGSILNMLHSPVSVRSPVWHGVRHHGISVHAIDSSAGVRKAEKTIFI